MVKSYVQLEDLLGIPKGLFGVLLSEFWSPYMPKIGCGEGRTDRSEPILEVGEVGETW